MAGKTKCSLRTPQKECLYIRLYLNTLQFFIRNFFLETEAQISENLRNFGDLSEAQIPKNLRNTKAESNFLRNFSLILLLFVT